MPTRFQPKPLKDCSLRRIALSFDTYWMKSFNEQCKDMPRLMYVTGPFDNLSNETIQDIIDSLVKEQCLQREHLTVLLQESLINLDLSQAGLPANHDSILQTIGWRCPRLVTLNLSHLRKLTPKAISDLLWLTSTLRSLDLSFTNCNDQDMSALGNNCLNLIKLMVNNTGIGNSGIFSLCQACQTDRGCRKLSVLSISDTVVNSFGALHCVQNLPELQCLYFNNICQVIEKDIELKMASEEEIHPYKLRRLHTDSLHSSSPRCIEIACKWCPYVTEGHFYTGINTNNIHILKCLRNLRELTIGNDGSEILNFRDDIVPVLKIIGHQLSVFESFDVSGVDIISVGQMCNSLRSLTIVLHDNSVGIPDESDLALTANDKVKLFSSLVNFGITYPYEYTAYQKSAVTCLLKSAKCLKTFVCRYMECLTDEILLEVYQVNPLVNLEKVQLEHCNNVHPISVWPLLEGTNFLKCLHILECWNIKRSDFDDFLKFITQNNFNFELKWK